MKVNVWTSDEEWGTPEGFSEGMSEQRTWIVATH